jgi:hypothetical protein
MKPASLSEIKKKLGDLESKQLLEICLRLSKYKKENKELLHYLLFDAHDEQEYRHQVKAFIENQFEELPRANLYQMGKSLRKVLRATNKYIKFSGSKQTEAELLLFYLLQLKQSGIRFQNSTALSKLYDTQVKKIHKAVETLHEDLQYDYLEELKALN